MPPKFGELGPETTERLNFRTGRLLALRHGRYITDSRQTDTLEQQNAGWAQAGLCHASSLS